MIEFAPGLPSLTRKDEISQSGQTRLVVQQHKATSDHFDMRLQDGDIAHSWVVRSLPGTQDKALAIRQPSHTADYMNFEGIIEKGYGKGTVRKVMDEDVVITKGDEKKIHMVLPDGEVTMIKTTYSPDSWLMIKNKPPENPVTTKPKYKTIDEPADFSDENKVLQPKIDGAHSIFHLKSNGLNRIFSYRSKKDGSPIEHTHQLPEVRDLEVPKELNNTVLRGEVYAKKDGKALPAEQVSGLLNSTIINSLKKQDEQGKLIPYIFDITKFHGKDVSDEPYKEKLRMINEIAKKVPGIQAPETAETTEEKRKLLDLIKSNKHPDTKEGLVEWDLNSPTGDPKKFKLRDSHDVIIREVFQAKEGKTGDPKSEAGGFKYSWTPKGEIVGNVGTGFSREKRIDMWRHPEDYVGKVARVKAQEVFGSGAMRAPSFYSLDVEKNLMDKKAYLEEVYNSAYNDELEKVAVSQRMVMNAFLKRLSGSKAVSNQAKKGLRKDLIETIKEQSSIGKSKSNISEIKSYLRERANVKEIPSSQKEMLKILKGKKFDTNLDKIFKELPKRWVN